MTISQGMGQRRFGRVNWLGLATLVKREIQRFLAVYMQTIIAPVITSVLFMTIFTLAFADRRGAIEGHDFAQFLAPGIIMMAVIQNAFANTSSSMGIAKVQGSIVDTLMPPLSPGEILIGYIAGGIARALFCAVLSGFVVFWMANVEIANPVWMLVFVLAAAIIMALVGLMTGIIAEKFDQMAAVTNFIITPLSFLSGTFYSVNVLPEPFWTISHLNPIFYLIDGFRHGVLGSSDTNPWLGVAISVVLIAVLGAIALNWLRRGYRLKS